MNRLPLVAFVAAFSAFFGPAFLTAQPLVASLPKSEAAAFSTFFQSKKRPAPLVVAAPNLASRAALPDGSPIFALPVAVDFSIETAGEWTALPDGSGRVWRAEILAEKARGLVLLFDRFELPAGAELFVSSGDGRQKIGAFSSVSCQPSGKMTVGPILGERAILELFEPFSVENQSKLELKRLDWAFDAGAMSLVESSMPPPNFGFGQSLACHKNINCPEGQPWQTEKKAVARVMMVLAQGTGFCTGTLVNQAGPQAKKPYLLTGYHCFDGYTPIWDQWKFDFGYESSGCPNPMTEPQPQSVVGCAIRSGKNSTDFLLLELNPIPQSYPVFLAGWNRVKDTVPATSVFIHHPLGDIKKWSKDNQKATIFDQAIVWDNGVTTPAYTHYKTVTDLGTFEIGSSGAGLFDQNKRLVGNLHGGNADPNNGCIVLNAYFGRLGMAWDGGLTANNRLKEWLDPAATGADFIDGFAPTVVPDVAISGRITTHWGAAMPNVLVKLTGPRTDSTRTDALGNFQFLVQPNATHTLAPEKNTTDLTNGLSTVDLVQIQKHLIGLESFTSPFQFLAADVNFSASVSTADIVEGRKIIFGLSTALASGLSNWRFVPSDAVLGLPPVTPASPTLVQMRTVTVGASAVQNLDFKAVKAGDVNGSADPN